MREAEGAVIPHAQASALAETVARARDQKRVRDCNYSELGGFSSTPGMLNELRFALRSLARSPGFTLASFLTLALGLGATTAIFSVLYAVLLRPFAYPHSERLVLRWQKAPQMEMSIAWPTVQEWQREQRTFSTLASYRRDWSARRDHRSGDGEKVF